MITLYHFFNASHPTIKYKIEYSIALRRFYCAMISRRCVRHVFPGHGLTIILDEIRLVLTNFGNRYKSRANRRKQIEKR